jgi:hypothetical protein
MYKAKSYKRREKREKPRSCNSTRTLFD